MGRVLGVLRKDLAQKRTRGMVADNRKRISTAFPEGERKKRFCFKIFWMIENDVFQRFDVFQASLPFVSFFFCLIFQIRAQGFDVLLFSGRRLVFSLHRFFDEAFCSVTIAHVCHRGPPIRDRTFGIQRQSLPKTAFRLEKPESVKLSNTLLDEPLNILDFRGDCKLHVAGPIHQVCCLSRTFVEDFTVVGVPCQYLLRFLLGFIALLGAIGFLGVSVGDFLGRLTLLHPSTNLVSRQQAAKQGYVK